MTRHTERAMAAAAEAIAGAFLAGEWEPAAMGKRAQRSLADRRRWLIELAHVVRSGYPEAPLDRPRELGTFIAACAVFDDAARNPERPMKVRHWMAAPTAMGRRRWPVPAIGDRTALATWLAVTPEHLDWFADRRSLERSAPDERLRHYYRRWVPKRDGSARLLESPKRELKDLQRQVLHQILDQIPAHAAAHGFRPGRSVRTGVAPHEDQAVVIKLDLESFFTAVTAGRVYGIFRLAGYPEPVAHTLAALCTTVTPPATIRTAPAAPGQLWEPRRRLLQRLRRPHFAQGSPTSPALANLSTFALDRRLTGLAARLDASYTRYADDLTFSGGRHLVAGSRSIITLVERIAADEGFTVNQLKTRVLTSAQRQRVTGLVVNQHANVARPDYDRLRAILHDAATNGPEHANGHGHEDFRSHLLGRIAWAGADNEARSARLAAAYAAITW